MENVFPCVSEGQVRRLGKDIAAETFTSISANDLALLTSLLRNAVGTPRNSQRGMPDCVARASGR
jgi:hypothetical protein